MGEADGGDDMEARLARVVAAAVRSEVSAALGERFGPRAAPAPTRAVTIAEIFADYEKARKHEECWIYLRAKLAPLVRLRGSMPAGGFSPMAWKAYRAERLREPCRKGKPPSLTTINLELSRAKTMLTWATAEEQKLLMVNPLRDAKRDKPKKPRKSWLPEDAVQRLLRSRWTASENARAMFRAWVLVLVDTGLRFNEARRLRRDRVRELEDDEILADIPKTKNGNAHVVGLTPRSMAALERLPQTGTVPYFFANPNTGQLYCVSTMWRWFRDACEGCGLDELVVEGEIRFRPHDARRSAATNAHARGADLLEIQDMLNHSSPAVTAQYIQRNERSAARIARLMQAGADAERARKPAQRSNVIQRRPHTAKSTRSGSA